MNPHARRARGRLRDSDARCRAPHIFARCWIPRGGACSARLEGEVLGAPTSTRHEVENSYVYRQSDVLAEFEAYACLNDRVDYTYVST